MNSLVFAASWHLRRFQLPLFTLLVLLQRTPVLRLLTTAPAAWMSAPLGQTLRAGALVATALGAVDTLAGATRFTANPAPPAAATVGTGFSAVFAITGANGGKTPKSYTIANLPPGLDVTGASFDGSHYLLNASTGSIAGTPTAAGTYAATVRAWENLNGTGNFTEYLYTIDVTGAVVSAPTIDSHPSSQTITEGGSATFSVSVTSSETPTYRWVKDNSDLPGGSSSSYTVNSATAGDAGNYWCVVHNSGGDATSNAASLTVNPLIIAPSISAHPSSQTVTEGGSVSFSVSVSGTEPINYQWKLNGGDISGANSASYSINPVALGHAGSYTCFVFNSAGSTTSNAASLTVNPLIIAPSISAHPSSQTVTEGGNVSFSVSVSGTEPINYQWKLNGGDISGANSASYSINPVALGHAGSYTCFVFNSAGSTTSNAASLTVNPLIIAPSFTSHPATQTVNVGGAVTFSYTASGTAPFGHQWYKNNVAISGANGSTYSINSAQISDAGTYRVDIGNSAGTVSSNNATLTVNPLTQSLTFAGPANQGFSLTPLTLSATASSGLAPSFTLVSGPATLNGTTLTLTGLGTVSVRADQSGNSTYAAATSVTRSFTVSGNFAYWQYTQFTGPELAAGALIGPNDIVTADGLTNLVKYALGLSAKTVATTGLPVASSSAGNWTYTYTRPTGQTDITVAVESSANLVDWTTTSVTLTLVSSTNGTDTWQATVPQAGAANLFFRLRATRP